RWTNRDGVGTRVTVIAGGQAQVKDVRSAASYQSANDLRVHFGLGDATACDIEVVWPSGRMSRMSGVQTNQQVLIDELQAK
ncbi:ASPIC/UnbV domain-containing protein, partial [bacterium]|nr:ASPIC/UnbV domain-containing protein [bacterium]